MKTLLTEPRIVAWTGGKSPPKGFYAQNKRFRRLVSYFFQAQLSECEGLDYWKCAGTSSMERARIFWNRAKHDAYATMRLN